MEKYFAKVEEILATVMKNQRSAMKEAAERCTQALLSDHRLFFFGSGHSHMLAEEVYYRAGGLKNVVPILETALMLHEGGPKSTKMERMEGYAQILIEEYRVKPGDVLFVISNSGINAVPVEMAIGAKAVGATVIALTSLQHSVQAKPRHSSGKKLYEIADLMLDNGGCEGDAAIRVAPFDLAVGPTSTVIGAFILNSVVVQIVENHAALGLVPQVFISANTVQGDKHNAGLLGTVL